MATEQKLTVPTNDKSRIISTDASTGAPTPTHVSADATSVPPPQRNLHEWRHGRSTSQALSNHHGSSPTYVTVSLSRPKKEGNHDDTYTCRKRTTNIALWIHPSLVDFRVFLSRATLEGAVVGSDVALWPITPLHQLSRYMYSVTPPKGSQMIPQPPFDQSHLPAGKHSMALLKQGHVNLSAQQLHPTSP